MRAGCLHIVISAVMITVASVSSSAKTGSDVPCFTWGVEWGHTSTFYMYSHYNYISTDGFRVNVRKAGFNYWNNGDFSLKEGVNLGVKDNLSLLESYSGLSEKIQCLLLSVRWTHLFGNDPEKDRWMAFLQVGMGNELKEQHTKPCNYAKAGTGYRCVLSRNIMVDLMCGLQTAWLHPAIFESHNTGGAVDGELVRCNNHWPVGLNIGIAVTL